MLMIGAITFAISDTPRRVADAWVDPVRRRHSIGRIVESYVPICALLLVLGHGWRAAITGAIIALVGEFVIFEYLLEPLGLSGHYFERGPRDEEIFTRP